MPERRLDDRIREICGRIAAVAHNPAVKNEEVEAILQDLRAAIHKKVERVRIIATNKLLQGQDADKVDRRINR